MAVGFELARKERLYDYRRSLKTLLGKGWVVFEVVFIASLLVLGTWKIIRVKTSQS